MQKWKKKLSTLKKKKKTSSLGWKDDPHAFFFSLLKADKILYNVFYTVSLGFWRMYFFYQLQLRLSRMCSEMPESCARECQKVAKKGAP